jgi:hypothetical protein
LVKEEKEKLIDFDFLDIGSVNMQKFDAFGFKGKIDIGDREMFCVLMISQSVIMEFRIYYNFDRIWSK